MRAAPLHYVKLYRTHLAAYMVTGKLFKIFTDTRQIFMTECVGGFRAARKAVYTLRNGYDNSLVSFGYSFHVLKVTFFRKVASVRMRIRCGAGSPFARSTQDEAVSQPASRPIISTIVTDGMEYTLLSRMISCSVVATYFAAEPKPGVCR